MNFEPELVVEGLSCKISDLRDRILYGEKCRLCQRSVLNSPLLIRSHFMEPSHLANEHKLAEDITIAKEILSRILSHPHISTIHEVEAMPSSTRKNKVQAELYRYIIGPYAYDKSHLLGTALDTFKRFRYHECFVVLALAVWKSECLIQMPLVNVDIYTAQQWINGGWKSCKTAQHNSNAMSLIVSLVHPFVNLGDTK